MIFSLYGILYGNCDGKVNEKQDFNNMKLQKFENSNSGLSEFENFLVCIEELYKR